MYIKIKNKLFFETVIIDTNVIFSKCALLPLSLSVFFFTQEILYYSSIIVSFISYYLVKKKL